MRVRLVDAILRRCVADVVAGFRFRLAAVLLAVLLTVLVLLPPAAVRQHVLRRQRRSVLRRRAVGGCRSGRRHVRMPLGAVQYEAPLEESELREKIIWKATSEGVSE